jgi:hypothetical protein
VRNLKLWAAGAVAGAVVFTCGGAAFAAVSAPAVPSPATAYGCDVGPTRILEDVYTGEANFQTFLNQHGGVCPDGFAITIGASGGGTTPPVQAVPAVTDSAATDLTPSGATLNGTVNPNGAATTYQFEYGATTAYGSTTPATAASAGSGTSAVTETASLTGLSASASYHYRLDATNSAGTTDGPDETFTTSAATPPVSGFTCTESVIADGINSGCGPYDDLNGGGNSSEDVTNDAWNAENNGTFTGTPFNSQVLSANSGSDWQVVANAASGNGAVLSYPDTQDTVTGTNNAPIPLTSYTDIDSTYNDALPVSPGASDDYEAAYDLWLGTPSSQYGQEIMVWTDNHGQTPAGSDTGKTWTDPTTGDVYEIWVTSPSAAADNPLVTFVAQKNATSGSVDLLDVFKFLQTDGLTTETGVNQMDYGFEICSTSGQNATFSLNGYTLNATGTGV